MAIGGYHFGRDFRDFDMPQPCKLVCGATWWPHAGCEDKVGRLFADETTLTDMDTIRTTGSSLRQ